MQPQLLSPKKSNRSIKCSFLSAPAMLNRDRILRTAPNPDGQGTVVLVESFLTDDEKETIDSTLGALARRQHPWGKQIYNARHYARDTLFIYINQLSMDDRQSHIEEFYRDRRGRSRSPRTIAHLTSPSMETPEPSPGAYTRGEDRSEESVPSPRLASPDGENTAEAQTSARASTDLEPVALSARLTNALRDR